MRKLFYLNFLVGVILCSLIFITGCAKKQVIKPLQPMTPITEPETNLEEPSLRGKEYKKIPDIEAVHFDYDDTLLKAEARDILAKTAKWLKENPEVELLVEGHCDERGTTDYNMALGDRRAKAIRSYLMKLGIKGNRIATISYGEEKPLDSGHTEDAWAKNRRGELLGRIFPKDK
ncbi:MAG: peptidoglycan-associated lipoprotein [Elusimicrobia bacterium RIFOXYD2_FULL_34_15]|nr:MAG: peptidoglycan-associated lipoprotein [Elusimicrobia bacterium RIFOXYD2_FULL_34_15]